MDARFLRIAPKPRFEKIVDSFIVKGPAVSTGEMHRTKVQLRRGSKEISLLTLLPPVQTVALHGLGGAG